MRTLLKKSSTIQHRKSPEKQELKSPGKNRVQDDHLINLNAH